MEITRDIAFNTNKRDVFDTLSSNRVFTRFIDLLIFAMSIGIVHDQRQKPTGEEKIEVARNTIVQPRLKRSLDFLFQTAILTTSDIQEKIDEDTRMRLAFNDEYEIEGFDKMNFLLEFAPYGLDLIDQKILDKDPVNAVLNLNEFFEGLFEDQNIKDELIQEIISSESKKNL